MNNKKQNRHSTPFYRFLQHIASVIRFCMHVQIHGAENEQTEGPLIVCANHTALMDVFALGVSFRRQLMFLAKKELFSVPLIGPAIRALGAFPVDRKAGDVGAIKRSLAILENGDAMAMFPQGTRCPGVDPADTEIKYGVGMLVYRSHADVQPVFIRVKNYRYRLFRKKEVIIGKVIRYEEFGFQGGGREEYERAARLVFDRILALRNEGK
ncbi:MAG: 1-acyl-sn-glycerol-3-phosphate acyltransferase [Clostridia bacterium]|nr:1-acyl-sn-glycerol-3-phosphate acyltransferase [Clostridia bacterium]